MKDLHNNVKLTRAIPPRVVGTTGIANGSISAAIDRQGYRGVEFVIGYGTSAAVTDVVTPIVYEGDTTNGTFTSVADADLLGTELAASSPAVTGRTSGVSQHFFTKIGYKGNKRYLKTRVYAVGTATCVISVVAVMHNAEVAPPVA